jgi:hypothetical protein
MYRSDIGLCYHDEGDMLMTRDMLATLPPVAPLGNRHCPVPFYETVDLVTETLDRQGFNVIKQEFVCNKDRTRMFGVMAVSPDRNVLEGEFIPKDAEFVVGLRRSVDESLPAGIVLGSRVFCCSNLAFSGEVKLQTRQTTHIRARMPGLVSAAIQQLPGMMQREVQRIEQMKDTHMNRPDQQLMMVELYKRGALNSQQLGKAVDELDVPSFDTHAEYQDRMFFAFNAATQAFKHAKGSSQGRMEGVTERSMILNGLVNEVLH